MHPFIANILRTDYVDPVIPVDCVLSDWSAWSTCSAGEKTRTRTVITSPSGGGAVCGPLTETESCTVGTFYSYKRDGTQDAGNPDPTFHKPYVDYIDEDGNPQTFYAENDLPVPGQLCGGFTAIAIIDVKYCVEC